MADQLTLSQLEGTDYAHHITTGTPGFSDLPRALHKVDTNLIVSKHSLFKLTSLTILKIISQMAKLSTVYILYRRPYFASTCSWCVLRSLSVAENFHSGAETPA